jgi:hypothetical protein
MRISCAKAATAALMRLRQDKPRRLRCVHLSATTLCVCDRPNMSMIRRHHITQSSVKINKWGIADNKKLPERLSPTCASAGELEAARHATQRR